MTLVLHGGMLVPSGLGICCAVVPGRRSRAVSLIVALLMFAAMLDLAGSGPVVAPILVAVLLVMGTLALSATGAVVARRRASAVDSRLTVHQGLGMLLTAALAVAGGGGGRDGMGMAVVPLSMPVIALAVGYAAYSVWLACRARGGRGRWVGRIDVASMGASALAMALMLAL